MMDEATLVDACEAYLNEVPIFRSYSVEMPSGLWIGVVEISGGERPYFALREGGERRSLLRFVAYHRVGAKNTVASPKQIFEWAQRDGRFRPDQLEAKRVELEMTPYIHLRATGGRRENRQSWTIWVQNAGKESFRLTRLEFVVKALGSGVVVGTDQMDHLCFATQRWFPGEGEDTQVAGVGEGSPAPAIQERVRSFAKHNDRSLVVHTSEVLKSPDLFKVDGKSRFPVSLDRGEVMAKSGRSCFDPLDFEFFVEASAVHQSGRSMTEKLPLAWSVESTPPPAPLPERPRRKRFSH